ncbi:MAG: MaoC/PaaZ C-terminal domain-containing protein [Steroidobacteraceae bacterium]
MPSSITAMREGTEVPPFEREISPADLVKYAGASDDYSPQHWDHTYMVAAGFPGVIVHGWLTFAIMCEAVRRWIPPETAEITAFKVRYHRPHLPGPVSCGGRVARIESAASEPQARLELWAKEASGEVTTTADVTLTFAAVS